MLAAAVVGYIGAGWNAVRRDTTNEDLTRNLRVIENMRFYEHVDDLNFLKSLDQPDLFGDDASGS